MKHTKNIWPKRKESTHRFLVFKYTRSVPGRGAHKWSVWPEIFIIQSLINTCRFNGDPPSPPCRGGPWCVASNYKPFGCWKLLQTQRRRLALPRLATATTILLLEMLHKIGDYSQNSFSLNLCNQDSSHTGTLTHSLKTWLILVIIILSLSLSLSLLSLSPSIEKFFCLFWSWNFFTFFF